MWRDVVSFTCTAREELGGFPLRNRTRNLLPAPITHASCPVHTLKSKDCKSNPEKQSVEPNSSAPQKEGADRGFAAAQASPLEHHKLPWPDSHAAASAVCSQVPKTVTFSHQNPQRFEVPPRKPRRTHCGVKQQ